jgi:hypothetical protein
VESLATPAISPTTTTTTTTTTRVAPVQIQAEEAFKLMEIAFKRGVK